MSGFCWVFGEPRDGLGECRGDTGPPGAKEEMNAFLEGDRGAVWPSLAVDTDNCDILLTKLSGIAFGPGALFLNALPPRSPFAPRAAWLIALGLNAGVDELLWNVELVLKFFSMAARFSEGFACTN